MSCILELCKSVLYIKMSLHAFLRKLFLLSVTATGIKFRLRYFPCVTRQVEEAMFFLMLVASKTKPNARSSNSATIKKHLAAECAIQQRKRFLFIYVHVCFKNLGIVKI